MSFTPVSNATLTTLTPNLDVGKTADPALRLVAFQYLYAKLTEIVNTLNTTTPGSSGSENIGAGPVLGVSGGTIHAQIADLKAQIQAIVNNSIPPGSVSNAMLSGGITGDKLSDGLQTASRAGKVYAHKQLGGF